MGARSRGGRQRKKEGRGSEDKGEDSGGFEERWRDLESVGEIWRALESVGERWRAFSRTDLAWQRALPHEIVELVHRVMEEDVVRVERGGDARGRREDVPAISVQSACNQGAISPAYAPSSCNQLAISVPSACNRMQSHVISAYAQTMPEASMKKVHATRSAEFSGSISP